MTSAQDHKRAKDGDQGLNTGGMGTFSPSPFYTDEVDEFCRKNIYQPTVDAMRAEGREFKGIIFFGLMLTPKGPKVLEYNARFGDPETQVVLPRMNNDLVEVLRPASTAPWIRWNWSLLIMRRCAWCWHPQGILNIMRKAMRFPVWKSLRMRTDTMYFMREASLIRAVISLPTAGGYWGSRRWETA